MPLTGEALREGGLTAGARRACGPQVRNVPDYSGKRVKIIDQQQLKQDQFLISAFRRPGGPSGGPTPDPIPNSAVKPPSANGTLSQDTGE